MTRKRSWLWLAAGTAGASLVVGGRRKGALGSPLENGEELVLTRHGSFGAGRKGPPAHAHQGVDLAAPIGTLILAVGDGVIVTTHPGLGKIVRKLRLDVPGTWAVGSGRRVDSVVYADLGRALVSPGARVKKGEPVAIVGERGFFHFAVKERRDGEEDFFDPERAGLAYRVPGGTGGNSWLI